jgi:hypothetical protein
LDAVDLPFQRLTRLVVLAAFVAACMPNPSPTPTTVLASNPAPTATDVAPTPSPGPSPTTSPSTGPTLPVTSWEEVFTLEEGAISRLVVWQGGLIGGGCVGDPNADCEDVVVSSADGITWDVIQIDSQADVTFGSLHRAGRRLYSLAFGHYGGSGGAIVWSSPDGRTWSCVCSAELLGRAVDNVIRSPHGTFAIGYNAPIDSDNTSGFLMWPIEANGSFGEVWVVHAKGEPHLVSDAMWTGEEFLAWGLRSGPWTGPTVLMASPDATDWTVRATIPGVKRRSVVSDILAAGGRLVAVGYEGRRYPLTPRVWISPDSGRTWSIADLHDENAWIDVVAVEGSGFVAYGVEGWDATHRPVSWESADGNTWTRAPDDLYTPLVPGFHASVPARIGSETCVAGTFLDEEPMRAAIYCRASG